MEGRDRRRVRGSKKDIFSAIKEGREGIRRGGGGECGWEECTLLS